MYHIKCYNCINYHSEVYNMVGMLNVYCKAGIKKVNYKRTVDAAKCSSFQLLKSISNAIVIKPIYIQFVKDNNISFSKQKAHYWRIIDDTKRYKRISGNTNYFLRFNTEEQLDRFYNDNKVLLINCNLQLFKDKDLYNQVIINQTV